jgi:hypothetical protein
MMYEELIETTNSLTYRKSRTLEHPYRILLAVLELHKPKDCVEQGTFIETTFVGCTCGSLSYPCSTIQAIQKELR